MNKRKLALLSLAVLTATYVGNVSAGNRPCAWTFSMNGSYYNFASKRYLDNIFLPNFGIAYDFDKHWAIEGNYGIITTQINRPKVPVTRSVRGGLVTVDGIYHITDYYGPIEPYVLAGIGVISLDPNGVDSKHQGNINAGGGAQIFVTDSIAFRFEARDVYTLSGGKNDYQVTGGLSFLFGGPTCCHRTCRV